jgi:hypothetical protein
MSVMNSRRPFDHLVGTSEQRRGNVEAGGPLNASA